MKELLKELLLALGLAWCVMTVMGCAAYPDDGSRRARKAYYGTTTTYYDNGPNRFGTDGNGQGQFILRGPNGKPQYFIDPQGKSHYVQGGMVVN